MKLKKNLIILFLISLIFFSTAEKGFAKTRKNKYTPSKTYTQHKKGRASSSKHKSVQKTRKKETNKTESYSIKTIKNFTINIPSSWQCIDDNSQLPENVSALFISNKNNTGSLTPTISISQEVTQKTQEQYVYEALQYHNRQEGNLQSFISDTMETPSGTAYVLYSERITSFGEVVFLQSILFKNYTAYVITGSSIKEHINALFPIFSKATSSFTLQENIIETSYNIYSQREE